MGDTMDTLLLGSGARESAMAWAIRQDMEQHEKLYVAPGNPGTARIATNLGDVNPEDNKAVLTAVRAYGIRRVIVGPEKPLKNGVVDYLTEYAEGVDVFGPTQAAARLETSKSFAIDVMKAARVRHPESWIFDNPTAVLVFATNYHKKYQKPLVVKADGLAGGKGVWICRTPQKTYEAALRAYALDPQSPIVVQEYLEGKEVSVFGFTDGWYVSDLEAACDYKRLKNQNTGGMGAYAPPHFWNARLAAFARNYIFLPVLREMQRRGTPYRGVLYAGLMILPDGTVFVLEFNCRLGDPEAQVILPRRKGNVVQTMLACARGWYPAAPISWNQKIATCGVVMASEGYPGVSGSDYPITGLEEAERLGCMVFQAATQLTSQGLVAKGGKRVLTVVGTAPTPKEARRLAYAGCKKIYMPGAQILKNIGLV